MRPEDASGWPIFEGSIVRVHPPHYADFTGRVSKVHVEISTLPIRVHHIGRGFDRWVKPEWCVVQRQGPSARKPKPKTETKAAPYVNPFPSD